MPGSARSLVALALLGMTAACTRPVGEWHAEEPDYRWRTLASYGGQRTGFRQISSSKSGIAAANYVSDDEIVSNRHLMHGSGVAVGDVDGDGRPDVYVARLMQSNVLYRNEGGWKFTDVTAAAGVALDGFRSTGVVLADLDGDDDLDLLVTMLDGPGALMLNDGLGRFTDGTARSGLATRYGSTTMALADVDTDGDLDLYVARYKRIALKDSLPPEAITWEQVMLDSTYAVRPSFADHYAFRRSGSKMLRLELGEPDRLYLNDGTARFTPVPWTQGAFLNHDGTSLTEVPRDWALTARFHDVNGDNRVDLYVCNDFEGEDILWLGDGQGAFRRASPEALRKMSHATMSVDFSDIDRDGHVDIFLTDMLSRDHARRQRQRNTRIPIPIPIGDLESRPQEMQNAMLLNRGDGTFAEVAHLAGIAASDWSWATSFMDVDLDGYEDLLVTTGHPFDIQDLDAQAMEQQRLAYTRDLAGARALLLNFPDLRLHNVAFRNRGDRTFALMPDGWGLGVHADVSHGMALGDLDADGDLDVVINRLNEPVAMYENTAPNQRIAVQLRGPAGNTHGVGATVHVHCPGLPAQQKEMTAGGQYVSSSQMMLGFAATDGPCRIRVVWPQGVVSTIVGAIADRLYEVTDLGGEQHAVPPPVDSLVPFELVQMLPFHTEVPYDDFARQPLLPRRLSQRGPGLALVDLNGDGAVDAAMGGGKGGKLTAYVNVDGTLQPWGTGTVATGDLTGVVALPGPGGAVRLVVAVSNYERTPQTAGDSSLIQIFAPQAAGELRLLQQLPFGLESPGPLALADLDGDTDLDLFVGGSFRPGAYPVPVSSRVYRNTGTAFVPDELLSRPFHRIGMVTGAALGDVDEDGDADVVLAQDWGPVRIMINEGGTFKDRTDAFGLSGHTGWWNGVAMGDFDEDGRLDLVATNWGWNLRYGRDAGVRLYYGDPDANGMLDLFESYLDPSLDAYVPARQLGDLANGVPALLRHFTSHAAFASSTLRDVLGKAWGQLRSVEATTLSSTVFLNRGSYFEPRPLPQAAQHTVATGVVVADINADGHEDLVLSQNHFALPLTMPRQDAGRGLWLIGDGHGSFTPMLVSGLEAYGEGRAVAAGDFDADGRTDMLLTQNGAAPQRYANNAPATGLRVRLMGPAHNPWGVGAVVRLKYTDGTYGPARLVAAGSGYWSQNETVQVLGKRGTVMHMEVFWPDRKRSMIPVSADAKGVVVPYPSSELK